MPKGSAFLRWVAASAALFVAATATAALVTYHVAASSTESNLGVPGGLPLTLEFTIDDATPASFSGPNRAEYIGAVVGGFLRIGSSTFAFIDFNVVGLSNDEDIGGAPNLLDQFLLTSYLAPGIAVPGLGQPELFVFVMSTFALAPTGLSGVGLDQMFPPATAFDGANLQVQFLNGDVFAGIVDAGPLPGPAVAVPEPSMPALLLAAVGGFAWFSHRRRSTAGDGARQAAMPGFWAASASRAAGVRRLVPAAPHAATT